MKNVQTPSTVVVPAGRICPRCGATLGGFGPEGLCGVCLIDSGLMADEPGSELDLLSSGSRRFGDYELIEEIARGGMGVIFKARQVGLNRVVALKMILRGEFASAGELARFRAEAETAARLQHPNIVAIHEVGEREGQPFFSMDYVEGQNLAQLVGNTPLPAARAAKYLKTVAEAIQYAHQQGILHRDLKPSNILIDESDQPRITDFGLAKRFSTQDAGLQTPDLTLTGQVLGSPNFMPPEQAAGKKDTIGPASDVYSLGAILYHALTGRPPFVAESVTATLRLVAESEPVSPRLLVPTVPRDLETICLKCLEKNPARRYATALELAEELDRFLHDEPIHARAIAPLEKVWRWCHRKPATASAIVLLLILVLVVAIGSPIAALRINRERVRAEAAGRQAQADGKKAQTEAAKSRQVAQFLKEMLRSAGPSVARGRDATVLREILEKTAGRVDKDLPDQPEVRGDLWLALGNTYRDIGDYPHAISMFENGVASYRLSVGSENIKLALALGHLGTCQSFASNVSAGRANAELGLKIARHSGDPETLAICLMDMARSFADWGMTTPESIPCLREAREIWQRLGNNPVALADCLVRLAGCDTDGADAEALAQEGLALHRQHLEPNHPTVASDMFMLGQILVGHGEAEEAEKVMRETYDLYRQIYDPNHPHQPIVLRFLAESLLLQGKGDEAESLVRQQVAATPTNAGHLDLLGRVIEFRSACAFDDEINRQLKGDFLMRDLADLFVKIGKPTAVEQFYRERLRRQREQLGPEDPDLDWTAKKFAEFLVKQGNLAEAGQIYRERMPLLKKRLAKDDPYLADGIHCLADVLAKERKLGEAESLFRETLTLRRKLQGSEHPDSIWDVYHLATVLRDQGKFAEAESLFRETLRLRRKTQGNEHPDAIWDTYNLASVLRDQGKFAEAESVFREALALMKKVFNPEDAAIPGTITHIADMLQNQGSLSEAERLYREAEGVARKLPSSTGRNTVLEWSLRELARVLRQQDKLAEAQAPYREAITMERQLQASDPSNLDEAVRGLTDVLIRQGKYNEAEKLFADVLPSAAENQLQLAGFLRERGSFFARRGRWKEAASDLSKVLELEPSSQWQWYTLTPLLIQIGDLEGYRKHCQLMLARFGATTNPAIAEQTAKACLLLPESGATLNIIDSLANTGLTQTNGWSELSKGMAEFRQDRWDGAVKWTGQALTSLGVNERDAEATLIMAMAHHKLNQAKEARAALAAGFELVDSKMPKLDGGDLGVNWQDVVIAHILMREAKALIEGIDSSGTGALKTKQ